MLARDEMRPGLHDSATWTYFPALLFLVSPSRQFPFPSSLCDLKTLGVITPTTGESLGSIKATYLKPGRSDVPTVPRSHGEVAGAASFLGLRGDTSGPYKCESL